VTVAGLELITRTPEATELLGSALAGLLPDGVVVALFGDLATGKTCLVRGMAAHYAGGAPVHSPTFTLVNQYGVDPALFHLDLYRLGGPEELADLGYEELFEPDGVCVVEWAERAGVLLPQKRLDVRLFHAGGDARKLVFDDRGVMPGGWEQALSAVMDGA
jgi:tRNA threonylcarbamoyladenosine biosynthesis protein TsaE